MMQSPRSLWFMVVFVSVTLLSGCKTVDYVDVERYMGKWYQISAYETFFNEGLVGVTAEYTLQEDGSVNVVNRGFQGSLEGPLEEITGNAVVFNEKTNAQLKVTFPDVPDLPYPNYLVVVLDEDYQYAAVSDPFKSTLFVLSRTPQLDDATYAHILEQLQALEYDTDKLLLTEQPL